MEDLNIISWNVSEKEYRDDSALSYSTLSRYSKTGFNGLDTLFDKTSSPSLTFGSAVDSYITGGKEEFDERFFIVDFPYIKESVKNVVDTLFTMYHSIYRNLEDIPFASIMTEATNAGFQLNWKPETRAKVILEQGGDYYKALIVSAGKEVLDVETGNAVFACVRALKESKNTKDLFMSDDPFDTRFRRFYQLKFRHNFDGVDYRCMADLIVVDNENKIVHPYDLKTSGSPEWDFPKSFLKWNYHIQARLYWRIIRACMDESDYWKDYELDDFTFIVINRNTLCPLLWRYEDTQTFGNLTYKENNDYLARDPFDLGKELNFYLNCTPDIPLGININKENSLREWLKNLRE